MRRDGRIGDDEAMKTRSLRRSHFAAILFVLAAVAFVAGWITLRASLPQLDGVVHASELSASVTVDRDALGVPTIRGADRGDLAYATGFLHAQDRFFQMDLLRRTGAGELAELFGRAALELDRRHRLYQFRKRAAAVLAAAPADERRVIDLYTRGVNDGLNALSARPFEYLVLRATPVPWQQYGGPSASASYHAEAAGLRASVSQWRSLEASRSLLNSHGLAM
jgi:penicillin G amidase